MWSLGIRETRAEVSWCVLMFPSASQTPGWAVQVCGCVFATLELSAGQRHSLKQSRESVYNKHTESVQTTTHQPPPEPCPLSLPLAAVTPVISLTWWWFHVKWGGTARQHFVVYHRLKLQVFQLVGLALMAYTVCACVYIHSLCKDDVL